MRDESPHVGMRQLSADDWRTHVGTRQRAGRVTDSRAYESARRTSDELTWVRGSDARRVTNPHGGEAAVR